MAPNLRLKYPIHNADDYEGKMIFKIIDEEANRANLGKDLNTQIDALKNREGVTNTGGSGIPSDIKGQVLRNLDTTRESRTRSKVYRSREDDTLTVDNEAGSVQLYLPQAIQIQDGASYSQFDLGALGASIEKGMLGGASAIQSGVDQTRGELSSFVDAVLGRADLNLNKDLATFGAQRVARKVKWLSGDGAVGGIQSATGLTSNPNVRTMFKSVPIRSFSFSFVLIPNSQTEAEEIKDIIKWFRTEIYPEAINAGGIDYGYRYPNRFQIAFRYKDGIQPVDNEGRVLPFNGIKFLPVYLQSFTSTYNPNGMGLHADGSFNETQVTMNFVESRALNRQDITKYNY